METRRGKKKRLMKSQNQDIPKEIVYLILSKLPVKSLARFKCVSRTWKSLISNIQGQEKSIFYLKPKEGNMLFYTVDSELIVKELPIPFLDLPKKDFRYLGSCNGLLLFGVSKCIYLWNPMTRCCKEVLQLNFLAEKFAVAASGLCFDDSTNDYKVVIAIQNWSVIKFVLVGSIKSKEWSQINFPYAMAWSRCYVNGRLHWIVRERKLDPHLIASFDTKIFSKLIVYFDAKTLEFKEFPMPDIVYSINGELRVVDGCLCMADMTISKSQILIMREYGVKESWTTIWNGAVPKGNGKGRRFRRPGINRQMLATSEELLVAKFRHLWCFSVWDLKLNLKENSVQFPLKSCSDDMIWDTYIESLVPVDGETPDSSRHTKTFEDKIKWLPESERSTGMVSSNPVL
ncbi:hypothetical protein ACH5RR_026708 [Cinchona calisaya]|uniref:F-box domain-containing protein n=1 Tax=Cinchona calisaya TaxID=153742 RepID=A0ABD2Z3G3_9GENT